MPSIQARVDKAGMGGMKCGTCMDGAGLLQEPLDPLGGVADRLGSRAHLLVNALHLRHASCVGVD